MNKFGAILWSLKYIYCRKLGQSRMKSQIKLKFLLEKKDETPEDFTQFSQLLSEQKKFEKDDINLLLRWAITQQKQQFAKYYNLLCEYGANVNYADTRQFKTNLMIACEMKNEEIVEILVNDKNINFTLEDFRNKTALFYAIANKHKITGEKFVRILLKKYPAYAKSNPKKKNPLHEAIASNRVEITRILLEEGFNPNEPIDNTGSTPLHEVFRSLKNNKTKPFVQQIAEILIEKGADPYIKNAQNKDAFDVTDKQSEQFKKMYNQIISKSRGAKPIIVISNADDRQKMYSEAEEIFQKYKSLIEDKKREMLAPLDEDEKGFDEDPFEPHHSFLDQLTLQINQFGSQCAQDYQNARKQLQDFIQFLSPHTSQLGFQIELYGSYATGLWINHCDIDLLLVPLRQHATQSTVEQYLEMIGQKLTNTSTYNKFLILRNVKIPLIRIQIGDDGSFRKSRKIDISILTPNNNGRQHVEYVKQFICMFPQIKPLFYVIKKLTYSYRLNDPLNFGIRSFAIFLMLIIFMQEPHHDNLGGLLLKFLYKFGYACDYDYEDNGRMMVVNLPDPINAKNNIGKNADAFSLQRMFKTAYLILHTRDAQNRLEYLFQSREMFA